jgi:predicted HD superfamily hydrolase involved in NAD metabolism
MLHTLTTGFEPTGRLELDAAAFLIRHNCPGTAAHSRDVEAAAVILSERFGVPTASVSTAAWLHDISAVFPNDQRLEVARQLELEILPEEAEVPLLLHQKISAEIAREIFQVRDAAILQAIGCHTTLRSSPSQLDLVLFVADKLAWDQHGPPPYGSEIQAALAGSLEAAAFAYQRWLWSSRKIKVIHPWMRQSYQELQAQFSPAP